MKPELMAPAGNWTMLRAAVQAGADAVYFGITSLNMRATAKNFALNELSKVIDFCHENNVKAYLTVNTIIFEENLEQVDTVLKAAKEANIDLIICWDFAVIKKAKELGLNICLSTQASVSNSDAIKFFEEQGIKRAVLARECSLKQIKEIKKESNIEIEVFIHGAMCVSLSGRCFLSHHAFGKSANCGECIQPCRREYEIKATDGGQEFVVGKGYVMSPKDLCTIMFIDKILESGVDALKIEGRKRSPEYVKTVVEVYRRAIDLHSEGKLTEKYKEEFLERLKTVYHRGFSSGFYFDIPSGDDFTETYGSQATMRKVYVGKVVNYYQKPGVMVMKVESESIKVRDTIMIQGPTTGVIEFTIDEIRAEDKSISEATKGIIVGIMSPFVRENDQVYIMISQSSFCPKECEPHLT